MTNAKRVLLVGSSFSAAPIFFALKKRGFQVAVCGNLQSDPCHQYADESFYIDYSNPDELMRLVEAQHFDFIVPSCNDYAYMASAPVAERFGFPGFDKLEVCNILHTKNLFREAAIASALPAPAFRRQGGGVPSTDGLAYPLLVKPVDSFSGRGVTKVTHPAELEKALEQAREASRTDEVVIEEFVTGNLHSHSAFIHNGKVVLDFFVDEFCTVYPYQVDCSNHPSGLGESLCHAVREAMENLIKHLGLCDGLLHTQFIAQGDKFWIIECMRRGPGDLYGSLVGRSTGVDYSDLYIRGFLGLDFSDAHQPGIGKPVGRHTISRDCDSIPFSFIANIPGSEVEIVQLKCSGERLKRAPYDKLAILFAEFDSQEAMLQSTPHLASFIKLKTYGESV
ncbi:ATP-grasp domain-containing protein [Pseudomonas mosselii]|uniref:ATP-grasp domain-containing protein n=1 Tax=Pseudomonas mosselii TaxID=78327 RepID=UPI000BB5252D|nr:ATP-grasp domain-containing protein [Pseudomonas mosselii]ATB64086.1 carbamoyl-phosphate synthase small subunit [Pseudomonas mosselii]MDH1099538.1 ATP-grasp domain-containing protein [Pseudomonas mosselii]